MRSGRPVFLVVMAIGFAFYKVADYSVNLHTRLVPPRQVVRPEVASLAQWSVLLGIFSILTLCIGGIPAILCRHGALRQIRASGGYLKGKRMAVVGLTIGYITTSVSIIGLLYALS